MKELHRFNSTKVINNKNNLNIIKNKGNISYISNISVTINQFFDKPRDDQNKEHNNLIKCNKTINVNDKENNKINDTYNINTKDIIPFIKKDKENQEINKRPINNIINIVLNNDNNNVINSKDDKSIDKVIVNEYINVK